MNIPDNIMQKFKENLNNEAIEMSFVGKQISERSFNLMKIVIALSTIFMIGILFYTVAKAGVSIGDSFKLLMKGEIGPSTVYLLSIPLVIVFDIVFIVIFAAISKRPEYFAITKQGIHKIKNKTHRLYAWSEFTGKFKEYTNALSGSFVYHLNTFKINSKGQKIPETLLINDVYSYRTIKEIISKYVH